jgi:hypothetical protein
MNNNNNTPVPDANHVAVVLAVDTAKTSIACIQSTVNGLGTMIQMIVNEIDTVATNVHDIENSSNDLGQTNTSLEADNTQLQRTLRLA